MMSSVDLLTVCVITYNHKPYIAKALDSILAQELDFPFTILIADDHSTDGTQEILKDYQSRYPDKIELILQESNVGPAKNWTQLVTTPKSKYLAYLEGDDYWLDTSKLKNQLALLMANELLNYCGAIAQVYKDGRNTTIKFGDYEELSNADFIKQYRFFRLSTLVIQSALMQIIIDEYKEKLILNEFTINNLLFELGYGIYYKEVVSAYNVTGSGTWSGLSASDRLKQHFFLVQPMRKHLKKNWSFFALQELITFLLISIQEIKDHRSMTFFKTHFAESAMLLLQFIFRLGFITCIPSVIHWISQRRKTGVGI